MHMITDDDRLERPVTEADRAQGGVVSILAKSSVYRDFERAFVAGTGLPLRLHAPEMLMLTRPSKKQENPFCTLMADVPQWAAATYQLQRKLECEARFAPKTLRGFAGLCETSVPVRIGKCPVAYLHTGQVLLHQPGTLEFDAIARTLTGWGAGVDVEKARELWFGSRVITPKQYDALIHLIDIFARHLAGCANGLILHQKRQMRPEITKACAYIAEHCSDEISLSEVARVAGMSANYFSQVFVETSGIHFVEYVARTRVGNAERFLENPRPRISEIAFQVGFQSLSQFNRAFRKVAGCSPKEYRADQASR